jgi:CBS domain-containing protein
MASRYDRPADRYDSAWRPVGYRGRDVARPTNEVPVREVMTRDVITVRPDDLIVHAAELLRDEDVGAPASIMR